MTFLLSFDILRGQVVEMWISWYSWVVVLIYMNNDIDKKKKVRVGIPRALLYYKYGLFWEYFFKELGVEVILSPETNKEIVSRGINCSIDESCLSVKIYLGHVDWLKDKADHVFVPNFVCLHSEEELCVKFMALVDIVRNTYPEIKIIEYTVDALNAKTEFMGLLVAGIKITGNPVKTLAAYLKAKKRYNDSLEKKNKDQDLKLKENEKTDRLAILIVSHPYTTYDNFLGKPIINYLEKLGVDLIYSDRIESETAKNLAANVSKTLYWTYHKELLGAVEFYKKNVDGIIFLTTFPCGPDSLAMSLCQSRLENVPNIMITLDELESEVGLRTRLESFADIIKLRKNRKQTCK